MLNNIGEEIGHPARTGGCVKRQLAPIKRQLAPVKRQLAPKGPVLSAAPIRIIYSLKFRLQANTQPPKKKHRYSSGLFHKQIKA